MITFMSDYEGFWVDGESDVLDFVLDAAFYDGYDYDYKLFKGTGTGCYTPYWFNGDVWGGDGVGVSETGNWDIDDCRHGDGWAESPKHFRYR
jgi:hypothetical protein